MRQVETERKFNIAPEAPLPDLGGIVAVGPAREHRMRAVYFDTRDLLLVRQGITLRHREGGADAGWHLKLPRPDGSRLEVQAPLAGGPGRFAVPEQLRTEISEALAVVAGMSAESPDEANPQLPTGAEAVLLPIAVLTTYRAEADLLDDQGRLVAQLSDDTVTPLPEGRTWRELEVELVHGDDGLLDRIAASFEKQGHGQAEAPSKLARALGDRPARAAAGQGSAPNGPAREVVHAYLSAQVAVVLSREADVRADGPDAVHKMRVATRRLRSALRTFRRLLDREVTDPLRLEVKWLADRLDGPRDAEVIQARLLEHLDVLPGHLVRGPVQERISSELAGEHAQAHAELVAALDSPRYAALLDSLVELLAFTPWRGRAHQRADVVLPVLVAEAVARAQRERAMAEAAEGPERAHLLHETRKRAKAARYAGEALAPAFGESASALAAVWEQVTETLGRVQDCAVAGARISELEAVATAAGEPAYSYGVLAGMELAAGRLAEAAGEQALAATDEA